MIVKKVPFLLYLCAFAAAGAGFAGAAPASAVPASAVPASAVPASAVPASAVPASAVPASAQPGPASAERLAFSYVKGDKFRVISTVEEDVYANRRYAYSAEILNRITFEIAETEREGKRGLLRGTFETSEREKGGSAYLVSESYDSEFWRDELGRYEIDPKYYMPVVRNVPVLPDRELTPGDTWNAPGEERHDFRRGFGIADPYAIPIDVRYRFEGPVVRDGLDLLAISASYTIFARPAPPRAYQKAYPVQIAGYSDQSIYWDPELGQPVAYEEKFAFVFDWSDGSSFEYRGSAASEVAEAELMDRGGVAEEVRKAVEGLDDVTVTESGEGVTISLEDIRFEPDSSRLDPVEDEKLASVAAALALYPDRDLLVAGHAAKAGYAEGRKPVSEARARAVAERLIELGARTPERIRAVGYGDERPIADNATEEGRARNRRVEITILEN
jgi:outer membrane protein OmpA-like peptidoglycan-associated protein